MNDPRHRIGIGLAVLLVTVVLLDARPATVDEVFISAPWEEGPVRFEGTVSHVAPIETSRGTMYGVDLKTHWYDWPFIGLAALMNHGTFQGTVSELEPGVLLLDQPMEVGDHLQLDTEFYSFDFNGQTAVSIRDAACMYPCLQVAMAQVLESVSEVQGMRLHLVDDGEWGTYVVELIHDGVDDFGPVDPRDVLIRVDAHEYPAIVDLGDRTNTVGGLRFKNDGPLTAEAPFDSVQDWVVLGAADFVRIGDGQDPEDAAPFPWIGMVGLQEVPDDVQFQDVDDDGLVGTGDLIRIRYPVVEGDDQRTLFLQMWRCADVAFGDCGLASKLVLLDAEGPYEQGISGEWKLWSDDHQAVVVS